MEQQMAGPGISNGRAFGMNPKAGSSSPPWIDTSSASKLRHFHNSTHSWVVKECCCLCTVDISNVNTTSKFAYYLFQQNPTVDLNPLTVNILGVVEFQLSWWTQALRILLYFISIKTTSCMILLVSETPYINNIALELHPCDVSKWRYYDF